MNRASIIALVIGAMLFGCGAGMVASEVLESEADAQGYYAGQKWEYTYLMKGYSEDKLIVAANELGQQGWDLVAYANAQFYFKRPLP